jgi:putative heme iron utilization protein
MTPEQIIKAIAQKLNRTEKEVIKALEYNVVIYEIESQIKILKEFGHL